ncbi:hypothetical protein, partial [Propionivibrio sp.]|uniref:hypothetical protein n=1 Tax=Propionivibrio sp. TaxID=2212460 RepID=UPI00260CE1AA
RRPSDAGWPSVPDIAPKGSLDQPERIEGCTTDPAMRGVLILPSARKVERITPHGFPRCV